MQTVSAAYKEQMRKKWRNPSYVRVSYGVFNLLAGQQAAFADNGHTAYGNLNLNDDILPDRDYATFEKDYWKADGKQLILPAAGPYNYDGFVSSAVSGLTDNTFATNPTIAVSFTDPQDIFGLTFTFPAGQVPQEIKVNGTTYNPDSELYVMPDRLQDVTSITIEFVKAPAPGRRVRLNRLQFGRSVVFQNRQLIKTSFESSIDFLSLSLTQKKLAVTIDNREQVYNPLNPSGLYGYLEAKQPMEIDYGYELDDGTVEWILGDNLVLESTPIAADAQASFSAVDNLTNLTGMFRHGLYRPGGISLYDLAEEVLIDAGVEHYVIDEHLKSVYTKAALPVATHRECLQIIANAGQCILYADRRGYIKLEIALDPNIGIGDNGHMPYSSSESAYNDMDLPTAKYADFLPDSWKAAGTKILLPSVGPYIRAGFVSDKICGADGDFNKNLIIGTDVDTIVTSPNDNPNYPSWCHKTVYSGLVGGQTYTFSAEITLSDSSKTQGSVRVFQETGNHQAFLFPLAANGSRQSCTFTVPNDGISYNVLVYAGVAGKDRNVVATYHHMQLEVGPYSTNYAPHGVYPVLYWTYSFPYSSYQIPITFDNVDNEYATDFDVVYKLDGAEIDRVSVTGNTAVKYTVVHDVYKTDRIEIEIHKWCRGTRRAMIAQIGSGRVNDMRIDFNTTASKPVVEKSSQVRTVTVNCYAYTPAAAATELYHENITPSGPVTLNISHDAASELSATVAGVKGDDDTVSETDAAITAQTHYTYYSVVTLTGTQPCTLTLTGKVLTQSSVGVVKQMNPQGEDKAALANPLITDLTNAQNTAVWIADYFSKRNFLTATYRGNPEIDAHDLVYMESQFEALFPARIMEHKIEFNGALSGSVKAVKMNG